MWFDTQVCEMSDVIRRPRVFYVLVEGVFSLGDTTVGGAASV